MNQADLDKLVETIVQATRTGRIKEQPMFFTIDSISPLMMEHKTNSIAVERMYTQLKNRTDGSISIEFKSSNAGPVSVPVEAIPARKISFDL